jgi:transcriptional regulator with XRE-family HTH domain
VKKRDPVAVLFGNNLRRLRQEANLSQEKLALDANLNRSYVGGIERGERNVALVNICRLAATIGCRPAELMEGLEVGEIVKPAARTN